MRCRSNLQQLELIVYQSSIGVEQFVSLVRLANPLQLVVVERQGVSDSFFVDFAKMIGSSGGRLLRVLLYCRPNMPGEGTDEANLPQSGLRAIELCSLIDLALEIRASCALSGSTDFDAYQWFGDWLAIPQPALAGTAPIDLIDTSTGVTIVARLLSSILSGAYQ